MQQAPPEALPPLPAQLVQLPELPLPSLEDLLQATTVEDLPLLRDGRVTVERPLQEPIHPE